jgi:hypothetical protein
MGIWITYSGTAAPISTLLPALPPYPSALGDRARR